MPVISRFYGIIIKMYFQQSEHNPPHFHAVYGEYMGAFDIKALVREWAIHHKEDLLKIWDTQEFKKLPPLE